MEINGYWCVCQNYGKRVGDRSSLENVQLNMKHPSYSLKVLPSLHINDKLCGSFKAEFASQQNRGVRGIAYLTN